MRVYTLDIRELENKDVEYIKLKNITVRIYIAKQKTGFGYKHFLQCPNCGSNRERLYLTGNNQIYCRSCSPKHIKKEIYRGITYTTRGGRDEIAYRMARIAKVYSIPLKFPFDYMSIILKRPKYMRLNKWTEGLYKLQILENMRNQTIFFNKKYEAALIQRILEDHLYDYTIADVQRYFLNWHYF